MPDIETKTLSPPPKLKEKKIPATSQNTKIWKEIKHTLNSGCVGWREFGWYI